MNKALFKLLPYTSTKIWGYEQWLVSTMEGQESKLDVGADSSEQNAIPLTKVLGGAYPLLIKLIQADETLSVQVHPDDEYARYKEQGTGKTECWYILDAKPGSRLISGLNQKYSRADLDKAIRGGCLDKYLYSVEVNAGDFIYIPAGTVHAIQGGLRILEIQQASDITYRLYDWNRGRELHIEKSLDVIERSSASELKSEPIRNFSGSFSSPYFTIKRHTVDGSLNVLAHEEKNTAKQTKNLYTSWIVLSGGGTITHKATGQAMAVSQEDAFMTALGESYDIHGSLSLIQILPH